MYKLQCGLYDKQLLRVFTQLFPLEYELYIKYCFGHISIETRNLILWLTADLSGIRRIH